MNAGGMLKSAASAVRETIGASGEGRCATEWIFDAGGCEISSLPDHQLREEDLPSQEELTAMKNTAMRTRNVDEIRRVTKLQNQVTEFASKKRNRERAAELKAKEEEAMRIDPMARGEELLQASDFPGAMNAFLTAQERGMEGAAEKIQAIRRTKKAADWFPISRCNDDVDAATGTPFAEMERKNILVIAVDTPQSSKQHLFREGELVFAPSPEDLGDWGSGRRMAIVKSVDAESGAMKVKFLPGSFGCADEEVSDVADFSKWHVENFVQRSETLYHCFVKDSFSKLIHVEMASGVKRYCIWVGSHNSSGEGGQCAGRFLKASGLSKKNRDANRGLVKMVIGGFAYYLRPEAAEDLRLMSGYKSGFQFINLEQGMSWSIGRVGTTMDSSETHGNTKGYTYYEKNETQRALEAQFCRGVRKSNHDHWEEALKREEREERLERHRRRRRYNEWHGH
jgi:hypothetical protein